MLTNNSRSFFPDGDEMTTIIQWSQDSITTTSTRIFIKLKVKLIDDMYLDLSTKVRKSPSTRFPFCTGRMKRIYIIVILYKLHATFDIGFIEPLATSRLRKRMQRTTPNIKTQPDLLQEDEKLIITRAETPSNVRYWYVSFVASSCSYSINYYVCAYLLTKP